MVRIGVLVFAALLALGWSVLAQAQEWKPVASDVEQTQYDVDTSSIRPSGGFVTAWTRQTYSRDQRDTVTRKTYRSATLQRIENCLEHSTSIVAMTLSDTRGKTVRTETIPQAEWRFTAFPPGSAGALVNAEICGTAARRAALHAGVPQGPTTPGGWHVASLDPVSHTTFMVDIDHVYQLAPNVVVFYARQVSQTPFRLPSTGESVRVTMTTSAIDCSKGQMADYAIDYYDTGNNLIGATKVDKPIPYALRPGSNGDNQRAIVCQPGLAKPMPPAQATEAAPAAPAATAEPEVSVGTGWLAPKGYVVTAFHVVANVERVMLAQNGHPVGEAEVVVTDPANDVAILRPKFDDGVHVAIPLRATPALLGLKVFTLGYPAPVAMGLTLKMTSGEVSALAGLDVASSRLDDARLMQVSIPLQSGNSGGPVIDATGRVAGIVISKLEQTSDTEAAQNVNYALKIGYVRNLLADLPNVGGWRTARQAATTVGQVRELQSGVFLVVAEPPDEAGASEHSER